MFSRHTRSIDRGMGLSDRDLFEYYKRGKTPSSGSVTVTIFFVFAVFVALGVYTLVALWNKYGGLIMALVQSLHLPTWMTTNLWVIILVLATLFLFSMFMAVGASYIAKRLGGGLIYLAALFINLVPWSIVGFVLWTTDFNFDLLLNNWPLLIPAMSTLIFTLLLFTVFRGRVHRAGRMISLTGQLCLHEKSMFVPSLLTMLFTLISAMLSAGIVLYFTPIEIILGMAPWTLNTALLTTLGIVLYLFTTIFFYNLAYSTTSAIAYIYLRGRDPTLKDGIRASVGVIGGLAALAVASVFVRLLRIVLRGLGREVSGRGGAVAGRVAGDIIGWIWAFVNYFTIPVLVCERVGPKEAIRRSTHLVRKNLVDVMIRETAVKWGFSIVVLSFFIVFLFVGVVFGWFLSEGDVLLTIMMTVVFLIFAAIPSSIVTRTFDIVYVTILYVFIRKQDGQISGKTAIPGEMEYELNVTYQNVQKSSTKSRR